MSRDKPTVLEVTQVKTRIKMEKREYAIIEGIDFHVDSGETVGIVGESGCGKSMTALSIMGLLPENANVCEGEIRLRGTNLLSISRDAYRKKRGKEMSMIFQEPMSSLNPVYTIGFQLIELLREHTSMSKAEARNKAIDMLKTVGIPRPQGVIDEYPHQLSGGMRQRVMIAMGLACNPDILIADEPTTALDVTIQAQILELMKKLQQQFDMAILLITHDLGVVAEVCDRVIVMYAGQIVEEAPVHMLFEAPNHPYTKGLIASTPKMGETKDRLHTIEGTVPQLSEMPTGCRFASRCSEATELCVRELPPLIELSEHVRCRCWLYPNTSGVSV
ncbi:peptide ABC transporter ATP-binding protein [Brevibacillus choshinensis]|uniref:Peptide ABC transporter ATP-binding protein n=1 Tax=Brevibacillus choshinensis TaxID=54911 RepID=A0ABR5NEA8_BRECH|nr:ABC transporter ATP-binding protein [Brevibacillus choshinensis]KQL49876.1 peptide ABC transporter ATP-binding protein [Brevibacillus choshinensis]